MTYIITTPLYYVNDKPHLGSVYTTLICDSIARYNRLMGNEVIFITGVDEHGLKIQRTASQKGIPPVQHCDEISSIFYKSWKQWNISFSTFIRTSSNQHKKIVNEFYSRVKKTGDIYIGIQKGWYCVGCEEFKDNPDDSPETLCPIHRKKLEYKNEENLFFKLSKYQKEIENIVNKEGFIEPKERRNEIISFVKKGRKDLSISRTTFNWGVPVPNYSKHVMYVWIDALCNYLTAIGYPDTNNNNYKKFWPAIHIVGKDILRFHAVYWPAFLMAAGIEPPKRIFAHGWWTNEGQKISKSLGNVIDPYEIINEYGWDQIRFFLFREVPFGNDGDFSKKAIANRINADLSNNFGNLVQRISSFIVKNNDSLLKPAENLTNEDQDLINILQNKFDEYCKFMNNQQIDRAIKSVLELISAGNAYVDNQAPWTLKKTNKIRMEEVLYIVTNIIIKSADMLYPIIPTSSKKILNIFNYDMDNNKFENLTKLINQNIKINNPEPIFPRILND